MDIYQSALELLLTLPIVQFWPDMKRLLNQAAAAAPRDWQLPRLGCEAIGGTPEEALPGVAAIACAQLGIILLDDLLDDDARGEYHRIGAPTTANLAAAFHITAIKALDHVTRDSSVQRSAVRVLSDMLLTVAVGQNLDLTATDEAAYWQVTATKSAPFFGTALVLGAILGGCTPATAEKVNCFGEVYGEMIQIHDDLHDSLATPASSDWLQNRTPLPILYPQVVDHPERERFLTLRQTITDPDALREAQQILIRCGALSYGIHHLLIRQRRALAIIETMPEISQATFHKLVEDLIIPVRGLFFEVGGSNYDATSAQLLQEAA
jgi:geranylgeranyl diphosphate synthase, type I